MGWRVRELERSEARWLAQAHLIQDESGHEGALREHICGGYNRTHGGEFAGRHGEHEPEHDRG